MHLRCALFIHYLVTVSSSCIQVHNIRWRKREGREHFDQRNMEIHVDRIKNVENKTKIISVQIILCFEYILTFLFQFRHPSLNFDTTQSSSIIGHQRSSVIVKWRREWRRGRIPCLFIYNSTPIMEMLFIYHVMVMVERVDH